MNTGSLSLTERRVEKRNALKAKLGRAEDRLYRLRNELDRADSLCWKSLPEGYGITVHSTEPWSVSAPWDSTDEIQEGGAR